MARVIAEETGAKPTAQERWQREEQSSISTVTDYREPQAYHLSYRQVEEWMQERWGPVDHSTINRWVLTYSPLLEEVFHRRKPPVWASWRMDETYIQVRGQWHYRYRVLDKTDRPIDFR
jgi:putative transposase